MKIGRTVSKVFQDVITRHVNEQVRDLSNKYTNGIFLNRVGSYLYTSSSDSISNLVENTGLSIRIYLLNKIGVMLAKYYFKNILI